MGRGIEKALDVQIEHPVHVLPVNPGVECVQRGYDDDYTAQHRVAERLPSNPRPSAPPASEPVESIVKWFNPEKGFGFVTLADGSDAFLHVRLLEAAGHSSVAEGMRVKVRIGPGQKGPQVSEVIEVDKSKTRAASTTEQQPF